MTFLNYADGVRGTETVFQPTDTTTIVAVCPARDCVFDGEVEASVWLLAHSATSRTLEYVWECPGCGLEIAEDRETRDGDDS